MDPTLADDTRPRSRPGETAPSTPPWGAARPGLLFRACRTLARATPQLPVVKQIAFVFRRAARLVGPDPVDVEHRGLRLRLRTRGNISESTFLFMPRRWDREERRFLERELPSEPVFVDVGANAGGYVWFLLDRWGPQCRVLAVEPDPSLRERLRFNLRTNGLENVEVAAAAVGSTCGEGWLRIDPDNRGANALLREGGGGPAPDRAAPNSTTAGTPGAPREPASAGESAASPESATSTDSTAVRVPVRPLVDLVEEAGLRRIDGLKVDVEGLEPAILLDFFERAPAPLRPRVLLVEWQETPEHAALARRLDELDYRHALETRLNAGFLRRRRPS